MFEPRASWPKLLWYAGVVTGIHGSSTAPINAGAPPVSPTETRVAVPAFASACQQGGSLVRGLMEKAQIPGMTVAVVVDGELVWSAPFGVSDRANQLPTSRGTVFKIASVSKLLTAAALARLHEEGKIDLDAPVKKYLPGYPLQDERVTPRLLAGHLAGLRHYVGLSEVLSQQHCDRVDQALEVFKNDPLLHDPGTKYFYSSYGYVLLSAAMEAAAGESFGVLVEKRVLSPLGLTQMRLNPPDSENPAARSAEYWMNRQNVVEDSPSTDLSCRLAAGGYLSTADDLARFAVAHVKGDFLKPASSELLFTSQKLADGKETGVGLGWRIGRDASGRKFVHHGGTGGGRAFVLLYPEERVAIAMCCNLGNAAFAETEALAVLRPFVETRSTP